MHCWSWTFLQNCQKSTIPKTSNFVKWAHSFPLDLSLHSCPRVLASAMSPYLIFIILFDFLLNYFILNQIKSNKIPNFDYMRFFAIFRIGFSSISSSNSYHTRSCAKRWLFDKFGKFWKVNQIKYGCIDLERLDSWFLT